MTLFGDVVTASTLVSETSSRSRKVAILADLLRALDASEIPICVGFLSGAPRQGRVGVGYRTIYAIETRPADHASLTVADVDRAIDEIEGATGPGSAADAAGAARRAARGRHRAGGDVPAEAVHRRAPPGSARPA